MRGGGGKTQFGVIRVMWWREEAANVDTVQDKRARRPMAPPTPVSVKKGPSPYGLAGRTTPV